MRLIKTKLTMKLPKVGDRMMRILSCGNLQQAECFVPKPCKVVYVNEPHNYYEVEFLESGLRECYSLPDFDHSILTNLPGWSDPIVCVETGWVYRSVSDCANEMGLFRGNISRCLTGETDTYFGYHFDTVL